MMDTSIVLFDGVCNLCSASVQWIIRHDKYARFSFASLQGETGTALKKQHTISEKVDSVLLIENGILYTESEAALRIAKKCDAPWNWLFAFMIVPAIIRNFIYRFVAKNRYRWFGKKESCWLPTPELQSRFLD